MKYSKKQMNLEEGIKKEWIITNGIGGFASSTIIGCNTRKYHGLLIAAMTPPARRFLVLSKIDEAIQIENAKYNLYTNMTKDYISDGYKYLEEFEKEYIPIFSYKVEDVTIKKMICMQYGENTVCILYKVKNGNKKAKLTLAPIMNFRDFHQTSTNHEFNIRQRVNTNKIRIAVDDNTGTPIYIYCNDGHYIEHNNDTFRNMYYIEEEKRGLEAVENHAVIGRYEVELEPNTEKEISIVCSLNENIEELDVKKVISNEIVRINELLVNSELINVKKQEDEKKKELIRDYIIASDNFIVYRPSFKLHTIIAGYPWFLDWGRDALISFEGLVLLPKRYELAKEILLTFTKDIKFGLVPNGYSGFDNRPLYNSADASLLLFEQVKKYIEYTKDYKFIQEYIFPALINIVEAYISGIDFDDNNIYLDEDGLMVSGTPKTQNTWMDAKYGEVAITPRNGKAVEINALWYNALKIIEELEKKFNGSKSTEAQKYSELAKKCKETFNKEFYNPRKKCLFDVLGDDKVRPNQLFAISLTYPVVEPSSEIAEQIIEVVNKKLLNKNGIKTLAKGEENYVEIYEGEPFKRDMSYHQGITWPWILGIYDSACKNIINACKDKEKKKEYKNKYSEAINTLEKNIEKMFYGEGMVGSISELYDSKSANSGPKGALAQAWSVAQVFKILLKK